MWNMAFFGFMAVYESSVIYLLALVFIWLILEFFAFFIPLSPMRSPARANLSKTDTKQTQAVD